MHFSLNTWKALRSWGRGRIKNSANMSGLSSRERVGLKKILDSMETCDLLSLNDTVTNRLIWVENVAGKISTYSEKDDEVYTLIYYNYY